MFWLVFFVVLLVCLAIYVLLEAMAQSRSSGPAPNTNWPLALFFCVMVALLFGLVAEGVAAIF